MAPTGAAWSRRMRSTLTPVDLQLLQQKVLQVHAADPLLTYVQDLVAATRSGRWFLQGLSPRAGIAVVRAAKAQALLSGRDYVAPDDVQAILPQTVAHRLIPVGDAGRGPIEQVRAMMEAVPSALSADGSPAGRSTPSRCRPPAAFGKWWQARLPLSDTIDADPAQRLHPAHPARASCWASPWWCCWWAPSTTSSTWATCSLSCWPAARVVGMHVCHATLRGLTMNLVAPDAAVRRRQRHRCPSC